MKPTNPPAVATWMLVHRTLGAGSEALVGDLLEEFRVGRSAGWYWRQVLAAIVIGLFQEIRAQWLIVLFAVLWTVPSPASDDADVAH
jgi:hypothetical protein